ncbi:MAG TPA: hypothetical protein PKE64_26200 [Anaerolineae bacterium]|nr:hypothetical protein [Anaerolineae bacterium]HMR67521.1 hypothetical protein [Anaerolineae bacterium]
MLTAESANEFLNARQKAFIEDWVNFFTGRPNDLLSFEEVKQNLRLQDSSYKGLQEVELDKIVGSTGRYRDFTRSFLPRNNSTEERWRRVDAVTHEYGVPPIELFKVGEAYFVRDGNHRVSVARSHGATTIEAYVIEYKSRIPVDKNDDAESLRVKMDELLIQEERRDFFRETKLDQIRPEQNIVFTEPGRYRLLKEHIGFHQYLMEIEQQRVVPYEEAVASWYVHVYLPIVESIRRSKVLASFPDRTEADLYAWLLEHRAELEEDVKALGFVPTEDLLEQLKRERATNPFARFMGLFRSDEALKGLSPLTLERAKFLKETNLDEVRPDHNLKYSEAGCYRLTKQHIDVHRYLKSIDFAREIPYDEAVASWYDNVYMPVIKLIRARNLAAKFPKNTESDLYLWLVSRREAIEQSQDQAGQVPDEALIVELEHESPTGPISRLIEALSHRKSKVSEELEKITAKVLAKE